MGQAVFFDLDGTLIDSGPGILACLEEACRACGVVPARPLDEALIGPPLAQIVALLEGGRDAALQARLKSAYCEAYDARCVELTSAYPGADAALRRLAGKGALYLVTNKRLLPTGRILEGLGWRGLFRAAYGIDSFGPAAGGKPEVLGRALRLHGLAPERCLYVGDTGSDREAAAAVGMEFLLVGGARDWAAISRQIEDLGY